MPGQRRLTLYSFCNSLLASFMAVCLAVAFGRLISLVESSWVLDLPAIQRGWMVAVFLVALEVQWTRRLIEPPLALSGSWWKGVGIEWCLLILGLFAMIWVTEGSEFALTDLQAFSTWNFLEAIRAEHVEGFLLLLIVWGFSRYLVADLSSLEDITAPRSSEGIREFEQIQSHARNRLWYDVFFFGGLIVLLSVFGVSLVHIVRSLPLGFGPLGPETLVFFICGLGLFAISRLMALRVDWAMDRTRFDAGISSRWLAYSLGFIFILLFLAILLPTNYSFDLLTGLNLAVMGVIRIIAILGALIVLPFMFILSSLLSLLGWGSPSGAIKQLERLPSDSVGSMPAGITWGTVLREILFWVFVALIVIYLLRQFMKFRLTIGRSSPALAGHPVDFRLAEGIAKTFGCLGPGAFPGDAEFPPGLAGGSDPAFGSGAARVHQPAEAHSAPIHPVLFLRPPAPRRGARCAAQTRAIAARIRGRADGPGRVDKRGAGGDGSGFRGSPVYRARHRDGAGSTGAEDLGYNSHGNPPIEKRGRTRQESNIMTAERRYTVGVLMGFHMYDGSTPSPFVSPFLHGMQAAARDQEVNLMLACGVSRGTQQAWTVYPAWPEKFSTADFLPVGPWNTDGLLLFNPMQLKEEIPYVQNLQEKGFPVLFIGAGSGTPMIMVDNEGGIHQAMEHLVGHGHRNIAFIAGVINDGDSQSRVKAYREAVGALGLNDDPRLMQFGDHREGGGYDAMKRVLQAGLKFTAVASSNDQSAVGAIRAIREAGLRIPWDVAVTGFDDNLAALAQVPPLTSIHYPLFETGYRALLLLRKRLEFGPGSIPEVTRVSTWLVPRQSCGCLPEMVNPAVIRTGADADQADPQHFKEDLSRTMMESLLTNSAPTNNPDIRPLCDRLVESFFLSLQDGDLSHFQIGLIEVLQRIETLEDDAHAWQAAISILRTGAYTFLSDEVDVRRREHAEDLLHQARALISESARRRYIRMQLQQTQNEEAMGRLTARLLSSLDEEQIYSTMQEHLPLIGIRNGYVVFFEPLEDDPMGGSRLRTYEKDSPLLRFASRQFPPAGLYPDTEPFSLALLPLTFQEEKMGYVAFDGGNLVPLATVVRQLASALKSAELHSKVLELSLTDGLTGIHNRRYFEIFLQKEVERSQRYNRRLATIMIDIDRFKQYNDSFGHPAGDEALRRVAEDIQNGARRGLDVVSRYGGEEFAVILPETEPEGAWIVAENIRKKIDADPRFLRKVSVSLGITSLSGNQLSHEMLIEQADRALYQAKDKGRNRTIVFEEWMHESAHFKKPSE